MTGRRSASWPTPGRRLDPGPRALLAVPSAPPSSTGRTCRCATDTDDRGRARHRLAGAAGVVVAPPLPYGSSGEHAGFAGTLSIGQPAPELRAGRAVPLGRADLRARPVRVARTAATPSRCRARSTACATRAATCAPGARAGRRRPRRPHRDLADARARARGGAPGAGRAPGAAGAARRAAPAAAARRRPRGLPERRARRSDRRLAEEGRALLAAATRDLVDDGWRWLGGTPARRSAMSRARTGTSARRRSPEVGAEAGRDRHRRRRAGSAPRPCAALAADGWPVVAVDRGADDPRLPYALAHRPRSWRRCSRHRSRRSRHRRGRRRERSPTRWRRRSRWPRRAGAARRDRRRRRRDRRRRAAVGAAGRAGAGACSRSTCAR